MNYASEEERGKAFPIHVEMGDDGPVLDLGERGASVNLPASGCVLVDFEKLKDGKLRVKTVCLPAEGEPEDEARDLGEALEMGMRKKPPVAVEAEEEDE